MNLIGNRDKDMKCITSLVLLLVASVGMAQGVPNTFTSGTPALAAEVNENFADVDARIASGLADGAALTAVVDGLFSDITIEESPLVETELFAESFCPPDTIAISANCSCDSDGMGGNFGLLYLCLAGDDGTGQQGAAAFCDVDFFFDNTLALPIAQVTATCLGATKVDGTVAVASKLSPSAESQKAMGMPTNFQRQLQSARDRARVRKSMVSSQK
jgi:hypothetical protein